MRDISLHPLTLDNLQKRHHCPTELIGASSFEAFEGRGLMKKNEKNLTSTGLLLLIESFKTNYTFTVHFKVKKMV